MNSTSEKLKAQLRAIDPLDHGALRAEGWRRRSEQLLAEILASDPRGGPTRPKVRRRSLRAALALAALVALGAGAAWAAGVFSASEISFEAGVGCYSEARLRGPRLSVTGTQAAADPVAKCEKYWREGVVDTTLRRLGREGKIDYPPGRYPPHLVACSDKGSGVSVFPGADGTCERLGLKPLPGDYAAPGREAARAYAAWDRVLAGHFSIEAGECRPPDPVARRAERLLAAHGYADVRVLISKDGPCATAVESRGRRVEVLTATPKIDDLHHLEERVADAVGPLFERAALECIAPREFAKLARKALQHAGLDEVGAHASQLMFPCTYSGLGFNPEVPQVEVGASSYKIWRFNRAGTLRYRRHLRRWRRKQGKARASNRE